MRCKIMRIQKFMWRNIMSSTKSQKASVLHYSIDKSPLFFQAHLFFLSAANPCMLSPKS